MLRLMGSAVLGPGKRRRTRLPPVTKLRERLQKCKHGSLFGGR